MFLIRHKLIEAMGSLTEVKIHQSSKETTMMCHIRITSCHVKSVDDLAILGSTMSTKHAKWRHSEASNKGHVRRI